MTVFADTSALYAVLDRDDRFHAAARESWKRLLSSDREVVTSNYVVVECFALVQRRLGFEALRGFNDRLLPAVRLDWITDEDHRAAVQALLVAGRRELSLVDCSSFQLMRRSGLDTAFAFDPDFGEQGFDVLPGVGA